ncbi:hypothetical protein ACH4LN_32145 [Streptomyces albus]|uniref:hypothetical protein n=1 Tax=Streptomyces TaxID=1883 RepID=UPI0006901B58|nr:MULTISPECIES: hypothetical protein [Streptomyces]UVN53089.1 hypothetical protein NR995_00180 [Streptomyces albus]GHJ19089.1 hypothetical protein TPA0909_07030 [Streptomyces albus]
MTSGWSRRRPARWGSCASCRAPPRWSATCLSWDTVPAALREAIEAHLGAPVRHAHTPPGGFGHQLASTLTLTDRRSTFVKAAPEGDSLTAANLHEAEALRYLPPHAPAPALLGILHAGG